MLMFRFLFRSSPGCWCVLLLVSLPDCLGWIVVPSIHTKTRRPRETSFRPNSNDQRILPAYASWFPSSVGLGASSSSSSCSSNTNTTSSVASIHYYTTNGNEIISSSQPRSSSSAAAVEHTWKWMTDFVVRLNLCPWALASTLAPGAIRIHLLDNHDASSNREHCMRQLVGRVADEFDPVDPFLDIAFCVLHTTSWDFVDFYNWFCDLEHDYLDHPNQTVTLAPFHPDWEYYDTEADQQQQQHEPDYSSYEKKSPYPTVTIVSTLAIDKAGPQATEQIAQHNQQVLQSSDIPHIWSRLFR